MPKSGTIELSEVELRSALMALTVTPDGDEYILGRTDLGLYVAVPEPGAIFINALASGASLAEATEQASASAGEEVDGDDFLAGLAASGLLATPTTAQTAPPPAGMRIRWTERVSPRVVRSLFGRVAWTVYAVAGVAVIAMLRLRPDLRPSFEDIWWLGDPIWSLLVVIPLYLAITLCHECWHWLAGRAVGVPARFRMSRRGLFVVFESDLSDLVTVRRRLRYSPMLAGIAFDTVVLATALSLRLGFREEVISFNPLIDRLLGALALRQFIVLVWQIGGIAFRSDSYAVVATMLGCRNLYRATSLTMKYRLWRLSADEANELAAIGSRDRSVARWFWLVYLAGGFGMAALIFTTLFSFVLGMYNWARPNILAMAPSTLAFWQSLALVAVLAAQYVAIPVIAIWESRLRREGRLS